MLLRLHHRHNVVSEIHCYCLPLSSFFSSRREKKYVWDCKNDKKKVRRNWGIPLLCLSFFLLCTLKLVTNIECYLREAKKWIEITATNMNHMVSWIKTKEMDNLRTFFTVSEKKNQTKNILKFRIVQTFKKSS